MRHLEGYLSAVGGVFACVALVGVIVLGVACSDDDVPGTTCTSSADCPLKARPYCDVAQGRCVAALDGGATDGAVGDGVSKPDSNRGHACTVGGANTCGGGLYCTNGVCCEKTDCGACQRCNISGHEGTCTPVEDGTNPDNNCGTNTPCAGTCQDGACDYPGNEKVCGATCSATRPGTIDERSCDGYGACGPTATPRSCKGFLACDATVSPGACLPEAAGCRKHADCAESAPGAGDALCDRTNAHAVGHGVCVDPSTVTVIADKPHLDTYVNNPSRTAWGKLSAGSYPGVALTLTGNTVVRLAGVDVGTVTISGKASGSKPVFDVQGTAQIVLQRVTVAGGGGSSTADVVKCFVSSPGPSTTIIESTIKGAAGVGISATNCSLTLRRSTISGNQAGGLKLSDGTFILTNNLIEGNGKTGVSTLGGVSFSGVKAADVTFEHNTVYGNHAESAAAGVICPSALSLKYSILATNDNAQSALCEVSTSRVGTLVTDKPCGLQSFKPTAPACLDEDPKPQLAWDHENDPRQKGGSAADLGCYEVH